MLLAYVNWVVGFIYVWSGVFSNTTYFCRKIHFTLLIFLAKRAVFNGNGNCITFLMKECDIKYWGGRDNSVRKEEWLNEQGKKMAFKMNFGLNDKTDLPRPIKKVSQKYSCEKWISTLLFMQIDKRSCISHDILLQKGFRP